MTWWPSFDVVIVFGLLAVVVFGVLPNIAASGSAPELKRREETKIPECQRCRSFQADFESQQRQHDADETGWREVVAEKDRLIERQAKRIVTLEQQAKSDQLAKQQAQERVRELTEDKQAAARLQCNADYLGGM